MPSEKINPIKGETYFFEDRPVTVMKVNTDTKEALVRAENTNPKLDRWVKWNELI